MQKKAVIWATLVILALSGGLYFVLRSEKSIPEIYDFDKKQQDMNSNNANKSESNNAQTNDTLPPVDVSAKFTMSAGNIVPKNVNAKLGQQVELIFEANFEDEVRLDEYGINGIYVLPLSEHSTQIKADKVGEFRIYLVKRNKTIGTLIVK